MVNSTPPGQNGRHFADDIFKWNVENVEWKVLYVDNKFTEVVPEDPIVNNPALV